MKIGNKKSENMNRRKFLNKFQQTKTRIFFTVFLMYTNLMNIIIFDARIRNGIILSQKQKYLLRQKSNYNNID